MRYESIAPLMKIDAYKLSHRSQYMLSGNVTRVLVNFTNRKSRLEGLNGVVHFGLQAFIQKYLMDDFKVFFSADKEEVTRLYAQRVSQIIGIDANDVDVAHIAALHDLGYLPLEFKAVEEGTVVPFGVPSFTVENTHDDFFWLPNYIETIMSASLWHPSTSATIAHRLRSMLNTMAERSGEPLSAVDFQGHDFSYRGQTSDESAAASGAGHLLSFSGSDSLCSIEWVERYYDAEDTFILGSVPATEHSVMSSLIAKVGEEEGFKRLLKLYPTGIVSVVSDTFDLFRVLTEFLPNLHDQIMKRDGKLVIRPDSGDPTLILCGDESAPEDSPARKGVVQLLWDEFGGTTNEAGFKVLDAHIGAIYGDSITFDRAKDICERLMSNGFASTNVVFGIGSYTYQGVTRDTFNSALKATWALIDGEPYNLFKNPATGDGMKKSATGRLAVIKNEAGILELVQQANAEQEASSELKTVWKNGQFVSRVTYDEVRKNLARQ